MSEPPSTTPMIGQVPEKPTSAAAPVRSPPLLAAAWLLGLVLFGVPIGQVAVELARGQRVQVLDYLSPFMSRHDTADPATRGSSALGFGERLVEFTRDLTSAARLRRFETELHDASFLRHDLLPWYQWLLTAVLHHGNEKAVVGREGWLFFSDDLASAYGPGYLEPGLGGQEALVAITDFRDQLRSRGVKLLLIPSYSKEMLDPDRLSPFSAGMKTAVNPDLERLYAELDRRGIDYVRMDELFARRRRELPDPAASLAMPRDSHWLPQTMAFCAQRIAERARALLGDSGSEAPRWEVRKTEIDGEGDLLRMLGLPAGQTLFPKMHLTLEPVFERSTGAPFEPDPAADVLLLGDSLTKVFSDGSLGLGSGAGFAEHLALHLNRALDVIAAPGKSATGVREALARRPEGVAGKKLVIWQFGVRMLAEGPGEWRIVPLPEPLPEVPDGVPVPKNVAPPVTVVGELVESTTIDPAEFDYAFCLGVMEYKVEEVVAGKVDGDRVWVAFPILVDRKAADANAFTLGSRHRLVLEDVKLHYNLEEVSWGDNTDAGKVIYYAVKWEALGR